MHMGTEKGNGEDKLLHSAQGASFQAAWGARPAAPSGSRYGRFFLKRFHVYSANLSSVL